MREEMKSWEWRDGAVVGWVSTWVSAGIRSSHFDGRGRVEAGASALVIVEESRDWGKRRIVLCG